MAKITDKGILINGNLRGQNPTTTGWSSFTDGDGVRILIHTGTIISLYEMYKHNQNRLNLTAEEVKELDDKNYNDGRANKDLDF